MRFNERAKLRRLATGACLILAALCGAMPVYAQEAERSELRVYHLKFVQAQEAGQTIAQVLQSDSDMRVAVDVRANRLIVSALPELQKQTEVLLRELDQASEVAAEVSSALPPVTVRVIWLGSKGQGADVPPGLEPVVQELGDLGISNLSLVGQMMINVGDASKSFNVECRPQVGEDSYQLQFEGIQSGPKDGRPMFNVNIVGHQVANGEVIANIANISSTVEVPLNQFIVLGSTSADGWDSVFVLQLVPRSMAAVKK
ncbi:MAG: secretin N-terminal domain-containing protein [Planctomycetia bacterium]|nr:secretin N-terminal domain-containing protein [Planctomycetia bacterium]